MGRGTVNTSSRETTLERAHVLEVAYDRGGAAAWGGDPPAGGPDGRPDSPRDVIGGLNLGPRPATRRRGPFPRRRTAEGISRELGRHHPRHHERVRAKCP